MGILKIKILAEDIREDNYSESRECPITRALARAGRPDLIECVGIYKLVSDGSLIEKPILNNCDYQDLDDKLFGMYATLKPSGEYGVPKVPIEDFEYNLVLPDSVHNASLVIDEATIKSTQVEFIEKKK